MKSWKYITLLLGIILVFFGDSFGEIGEYLKIVGIVLLMYTLYRISSGLTSKNKNSDSDNLRL